MAKPPPKSPPPKAAPKAPVKAAGPEPLTSPAIKAIAGKGLRAPSTVTTKEVQKLAASVEAHIEPRKPKG